MATDSTYPGRLSASQSPRSDTSGSGGGGSKSTQFDSAAVHPINLDCQSRAIQTGGGSPEIMPTSAVAGRRRPSQHKVATPLPGCLKALGTFRQESKLGPKFGAGGTKTTGSTGQHLRASTRTAASRHGQNRCSHSEMQQRLLSTADACGRPAGREAIQIWVAPIFTKGAVVNAPNCPIFSTPFHPS